MLLVLISFYGEISKIIKYPTSQFHWIQLFNFILSAQAIQMNGTLQ